MDENWLKKIESILPPGGTPQDRREMSLAMWFQHVKEHHNLSHEELKKQMLETLRDEKKRGSIGDGAFAIASVVLGLPNPIQMLADPFWSDIFEIDGHQRLDTIIGKSPSQMPKGWCERHWEPFKTTNSALATSVLVRTMVMSPKFMRMCGWKPETGEQANPEFITREMERMRLEFGAICCFLGDKVMTEILQKVRTMTGGQEKE